MIPDGNALLNEIVGKNWMVLLLIYNVLAVIFPNAGWLKRIGAAFADRFPQFRGNG